jgi:hypothetical protein
VDSQILITRKKLVVVKDDENIIEFFYDVYKSLFWPQITQRALYFVTKLSHKCELRSLAHLSPLSLHFWRPREPSQPWTSADRYKRPLPIDHRNNNRHMGHRAQTVDTPTVALSHGPQWHCFSICTSVPSRHRFLSPPNSNSPKCRADKTNDRTVCQEMGDVPGNYWLY